MTVRPAGNLCTAARKIGGTSMAEKMKNHDKHANGNGHHNGNSYQSVNGYRAGNGCRAGNGVLHAVSLRLGKDCKYERELSRLQVELVKLQEWIRHEGLRVVVLFEGRDAAGKGGAIKRIAESLNPRACRIVALATPTEREKTQWYFQRYVPHLPAAGEMVLFDRSWYNRAGVEHVMGFCTDKEYLEFMQSCPEFERMLVRSGIILLKYWFSVSDEEQERRFQDRMRTPTKRWKLSPMDLESRKHWADYSRAKDEMFAVTDTKQVPWYVVNAEDKKKARLNVIRHLLSIIPYKDLTPESLKLPPIMKSKYVRPPIQEQNFIPEIYG
ncbi:MAG: polyphosphate kinase 2 [Terracidiphilus sp.]|jgi:polyphosphate kinase 2